MQGIDEFAEFLGGDGGANVFRSAGFLSVGRSGERHNAQGPVLVPVVRPGTRGGAVQCQFTGLSAAVVFP